MNREVIDAMAHRFPEQRSCGFQRPDPHDRKTWPSASGDGSNAKLNLGGTTDRVTVYETPDLLWTFTEKHEGLPDQKVSILSVASAAFGKEMT